MYFLPDARTSNGFGEEARAPFPNSGWKSSLNNDRFIIFRNVREPPQEEKRKTVMDEEEFDTSIEEKSAKTETEIMQWLQSLFLFSLCWSIGGNLDADSRLKFSDFLKVLEAGTNKQHQRFE